MPLSHILRPCLNKSKHKRVRKWGVSVSLKRRATKLYMPSIALDNIHVLNNEVDELCARIKFLSE